MPNHEPSNAVLHTLIQGIDRNVSTILDSMKEMNDKVLDNQDRITKIEERTRDYPDYKKEVDLLHDWRLWLAGGGAALLLTGGIIWASMKNDINNAIESIDQKISEGIDDAFNSRFSNVRIEE